MRFSLPVKLLAVGILILGLSGCQKAQEGGKMTLLVKASLTPSPTVTATAADTATATSSATPTLTQTPVPTETATPKPAATHPKPTKTAASASGGGCAGANSGFESTLLALINAERSNNGIASLSSSGSLFSLARAHSEDMAENNYFDHNSLSGATPFDRMSSAGISFTAAAENIYAGNGTNDSPSAAFAGWMASQGHRENMLNSAYTLAGVGYWCDSSSAYGGYFTLDLIHP